MSHPVHRAIDAALTALGKYVPNGGVQPADLSMVQLVERPIGLGNFHRLERRGPFAPVERWGLRLDGVARFVLWGADAAAAEEAARMLEKQIVGDRDLLARTGFLRLDLDAAPTAERIDAANAWRKQAEYRLAYEFGYEDPDASSSLLVEIPIHGDQEVRNAPWRETTVVTDEMVRWDETRASPLLVRGPQRIGRLAAIAYLPGLGPSGAITITRTFDGATGPPHVHATLAEFLLAATSRANAEVTFASITAFLAALPTPGGSFALGDWDKDDTIDTYTVRSLPIAPPLSLDAGADRLEIRHERDRFDQIGVLYLRALRA